MVPFFWNEAAVVGTTAPAATERAAARMLTPATSMSKVAADPAGAEFNCNVAPRISAVNGMGSAAFWAADSTVTSLKINALLIFFLLLLRALSGLIKLYYKNIIRRGKD
jgi:hypothetical protein